MAEAKIKTIRSMVNEINFVGRSLLSVNDLTDDQMYGLFNLALRAVVCCRNMRAAGRGAGARRIAVSNAGALRVFFGFFHCSIGSGSQ